MTLLWKEKATANIMEINLVLRAAAFRQLFPFFGDRTF